MSILVTIKFGQKSLLYHFVSTLIVIVLITSESQCLSDEDILSNLRPLKYSKTKEACKTFCKSIICETIKECKNGAIVKKSSYCNCCDACVKYLGIGDRCKNLTEGSLALENQERCIPGTKCNISNQCTIDRDVNSCLRLRDIRTEIKGVENYTENIWIPQCDRKGNFKARQQKTEKSICVDKLGHRIFGNADDLLDNTCYCSRHILEESKKDSTVFKPREHCTSSGGFDTLQCINNLCYCTDHTGHVKSSSLVRIDFLNKLPCYDEKYHELRYLNDCEKMLKRTRKIASEFKHKNINLDSIDTVKCDPDGSFSPVQRHENEYKCTDKKGNGIGSYKKEIAEDISLKMTCNCARESSRDFNSAITCLGDGSYRKVMCRKDECFCLDQDGSRISKGIMKSENINSFCIKLFEDSFKYPLSGDDNDSGGTDEEDEYTDNPDFY